MTGFMFFLYQRNLLGFCLYLQILNLNITYEN